MRDINCLMRMIADALPDISRQGQKTIREVSLCYLRDGEWQVLAGGHYAVALGEWGGDFSSWGVTAEDALEICLRSIKQ